MPNMSKFWCNNNLIFLQFIQTAALLPTFQTPQVTRHQKILKQWSGSPPSKIEVCLTYSYAQETPEHICGIYHFLSILSNFVSSLSQNRVLSLIPCISLIYQLLFKTISTEKFISMTHFILMLLHSFTCKRWLGHCFQKPGVEIPF